MDVKIMILARNVEAARYKLLGDKAEARVSFVDIPAVVLGNAEITRDEVHQEKGWWMIDADGEFVDFTRFPPRPRGAQRSGGNPYAPYFPGTPSHLHVDIEGQFDGIHFYGTSDEAKEAWRIEKGKFDSGEAPGFPVVGQIYSRRRGIV